MNLTAWCQAQVTILSTGAGILAGILGFSPGGAMAKDVFPFPATTRTLDVTCDALDMAVPSKNERLPRST